MSTWYNGQGPEGVEPRPNIIRELAVIFDVRPEYLLYGGARTVREAAIAREATLPDEGPSLSDRIAQAIPGFTDLSPPTQILLLLHMNRWEAARKREGFSEPSLEEAEAYVRNLWNWIMHPVAAWKTTLSQSEISDYVDAALHTRNLALNFSRQAHRQE